MRVNFSWKFWWCIAGVCTLSACGGGGGGDSSKSSAPATYSAGLSSVASSAYDVSSALSTSAESSAVEVSSIGASVMLASSSRSSAVSLSSLQSSSAQSSMAVLGYTQQAIFDDWFYDVTGYPNGFNFFLYVPISYQAKPADRYPLVIVLHGDNGYKELRPKLTTYPLPTGVFSNFLLESGELNPAARDTLNPHLKDAFVVHPEIPHIDREVYHGERLGWWNPEELNKLVAYMEQVYRIDAKRIYVVGASMGGIGTFNYAAANPDKIAAIAPVCGGLDDYLNRARSLRGMPIWTFLNYDDQTIPFHSYILPMVDQFAGQDVWSLYPSSKPPINDYTISYSSEGGLRPWVLGSDIAEDEFNFTLYAFGGHNSWDKTFAKDALWDWLFSKVKR